MSVETPFASQIVKIRRRLIVQAVHRILLNASLVFLSINSFFFIPTIAGISDHKIKGTWVFILIGASLSAALLIGRVRRGDLLNILIDIDRRLKLQDRVSTAYEYLKFKKKTEFSDLLLNDAAAKLRHIQMQQLVPVRFSLLHLLVIILLVINIFGYSRIFSPSDSNPSTHAEIKKIEKAASLLKNFMISRIDDRTTRPSKPQSYHADKLEQFSNKLNDSSKPFPKRLAAMDRILMEVRGEKTRLANELGIKLDAAGIKELPIPEIPGPANLSSSQLEKLKGFLNQTLSHRIPDSVGRHIESLEELESIEKFLSRIIDDLKGGRSFSGDPAGNQSRTPQTSGTLENPADDHKPNPDNPFSKHGPSAADRIAHPGSGKLRNNDDDLQNGRDPREGYSTSAGRAKSKNKTKTSHPLEKSQGSPIKDKMAPSQAKRFLIRIRALTDIGEARLPEEENFQTYRKEIESILQKDDIPANYREYIKNYFMSIGINTEENGHENK